jgi:hypothetical protein
VFEIADVLRWEQSRVSSAARAHAAAELAWAQGAGMPMSPAMSVMMTAEVPPI